jgi:very-short-patch-repair endonuclease
MGHGPDESLDMQGKQQERGIAELAERQYGLITRAQLTELGIGSGAIEHRVRLKRLHLLHRGVYAVGQRQLPREARWLAAVFAYGPGTVLSHRAGGTHWQLVRDSGWCDVTLPQWRRPRPGITVHQARLPADEITIHAGIPITTVPRTLFDLAAVLPARQLERAINEAEVRQLWDELSLEHLLARYPRRAGARAVRVALHGRRQGLTLTRSEAEELFMTLIDEAGLPRPEINVLVEGELVDAVWRGARLIVELDGRRTHGTAAAFERDRERDRRLQVADWRVIRITYRQMVEAARPVIADVRRLLALGGIRLAA